LVCALVGLKGDRRLVKRFVEREIERMRTIKDRGRAARVASSPTWGRGEPAVRERAPPLSHTEEW
jgi:hypothetical protein